MRQQRYEAKPNLGRVVQSTYVNKNRQYHANCLEERAENFYEGGLRIANSPS